MPKVKTKKAAAKRFKMTGTGKLKRMKAYKSQDQLAGQHTPQHAPDTPIRYGKEHKP